MLSFLYSPTLTPIYDWKNHRLNYTERQEKQKILRSGKNTQKNYTKKIFMTQTITMV